AGPWAGRVAALAGVSVPVQPSAGVMVALAQRLNQRVINRLRPPGDGDIIVPQRLTSIIGTTSWNVESGDRIPVPPDHVRRMIDEGAKLIPAVRSAPILSAFAAARPLVAGNKESDGRELSRGFQVFDHGRGDGADGLLSVVGGKTTTSRLMAEIVGDRVCEKLGVRRECRTKELPLLPFYRFRWQGGS
ncbi:MAG: FAD-dependent oxidoreductase, partial [Clostridia bacterium]|nr:FAD-dependent oxidoreductase [Clostridia bacterium]